MAIGDFQLGTGVGLNRPSLQNWGWLKRSFEQGPPSLGHQISELLYGLQMEIKDLHEYRARLTEALGRLQDLREPLETPVSGLILPREKRLFQVGSIAWQPPPWTESEPFSATPRQVFEARRLARIHQFIASEEAGLSHQVEIKLSAGKATVRSGFDEVRLSMQGVQVLRDGSEPAVKVLRLPPKFHRQVDLLRCVAG